MAFYSSEEADSKALLSKPAQPNKASEIVVVGIYGLPGSGKTFLLNQLKNELMNESFNFYDGSDLIAAVCPGGLETFNTLQDNEKALWRRSAIELVRSDCVSSDSTAVVAGHFMLWPEEQDTGQPVHTQADLEIYTHILYLDTPVETISQRRQRDTIKARPLTSLNHLREWQQAEKTQLRTQCRDHGILFMTLSEQPTSLDRVLILLRDFQAHTEDHNMSIANRILNDISPSLAEVETMLVLDADRTLAATDTGTLFWKTYSKLRLEVFDDPLKTIFGSSLGYSYTAFRQATLLYEEVADDEEYEVLCSEIASQVTMYPEFVSLLKGLQNKNHVGAVVITCGLRRVWERILDREGLFGAIKVIGGGRIDDAFVVTASVKASLVHSLKTHNQVKVWAFGDSPLDLEMLRIADEAIVVVGEEDARSNTMELDLFNLIQDGGLRAHQTLLPENCKPRLNTNMLPLVSLTDPRFINAIERRHTKRAGVEVHHATHNPGTKLLMTPMRDRTVGGPALREHHRRVGQHLTIHFLTSVIGIEELSIRHVQGHCTSGFRLIDEQKTLIIALMRGGEPMAFGVNDIVPLATFLHAKDPDDITPRHLEGYSLVLLVDSVINNGKTVLQFETHVRKLDPTIRIVVIAGVVQAGSVAQGSLLHDHPREVKLDIIALRLSDNKFTGRGTSDTGNRLFNTTHIP